MKLRCPICQYPLISDKKTLSCENNHTFDIAKQGYVHLNPTNSSKKQGDEKQMVLARTSFLSKGYYLPLKNVINNLIQEIMPTSLIDLACGEGYYTKDFPCQDILGVDLSKEAISHASKVDKKNQYIVSSIFNLPLDDASVDCATVLFAPIATEEITRVLKSQGHLILVTPGHDHLFELKQVLYSTPYKNDSLVFDGPFKQVNKIEVKEKIHLSCQEDILNLFSMTPYYYKTSLSDKEKLYSYHQLDVSLHFVVYHFRKDDA